AIPLVALLAGCSLREPRVSYSACSASSQCSSANVCFLGQCRAPAANLSVVSVEVRPPSGSPFALKEVQVDLRRSVLNDFSLAPPLAATGSVTQDGGAVPGGATVTFTDHAPVIPDRIDQVVSVTDTSGTYRAQLPQRTWDVLVQPAAPNPPLRAGPIDPLSTYPPQPYVTPLTLPLPPVAALDVNVLDSAGVPVPSALVYVRSTGTAWTLARSVVADGGVSTLSLREGGYLVQAAPPSDT